MNTPSFDTRRVPPPAMPRGRQHDITLTEEVLALANAHERHEYARYRWLSLRFLAFHTGISRLMKALAEESQQRMQALATLAGSLPLDASAIADPAESPEAPPALTAGTHFFIVDGEVATQALSRAMLEEWWSRRFYERLQAYNAIPQLDAWINDAICQARSQFQVLQETEGLMPPSLSPPHAMMEPMLGQGRGARDSG